ncbi:hypothetical protein FB45DRAFT_732143 [Roridomyces roridus]|uniref:Uncharacterized protein n=1 Tax=Roridomyces roridus TaxID=1738132 RepID=A0AAD7CJ15_9AGAR|nr:hypothetical protein FB45DRAFT_732143 [Roridomyces roridus]
MSFRPSFSVEDTEEYQYVLTNFRIAHEKVEEQRKQLDAQEDQVAQLRARIELLEGGPGLPTPGGNSVDDFSIKNGAAQLDKLINRWASEILRQPPTDVHLICEAAMNDIVSAQDYASNITGTSMQVSKFAKLPPPCSEGFINCLIVTNSKEANIQLTRIHEHIFNRDPTLASVWRRQTFSAAVESCTEDMSYSILSEHIPHLTHLLQTVNALPSSVLDSAYHFSRMLHASRSTGSAFYRAFVPELGAALQPREIELVKRCLRHERGELDRVGCTMFPGLVKVDGGGDDNTVVRRAQVICECAMTPESR